ncbi:MAG: NAD(P)H-binding protein [Bifidobacterium sp.]|nr:NAD(P)H-binding protein [Bifidobacterium sp.]
MTEKIAVVAANGREGRLIVEEAVKRGMDVTAIVRGENKTDAQHAIIKDAFDLTKDDLKGFDAVVDAFGVWDPAKQDETPRLVNLLADLLAGTDTRLLVVGGAGSLLVPGTDTALADTPDFPDSFKPVAAAAAEALKDLRKRDDVEWTFISPAADFQADGPRTGAYQVGGDEMVMDKDGKSEISYADYAIGMVDEIENKDPHIRERITFAWK